MYGKSGNLDEMAFTAVAFFLCDIPNSLKFVCSNKNQKHLDVKSSLKVRNMKCAQNISPKQHTPNGTKLLAFNKFVVFFYILLLGLMKNMFVFFYFVRLTINAYTCICDNIEINIHKERRKIMII